MLGQVGDCLRASANKPRLAGIVDCLVNVLEVPFAFVAESLDGRSVRVLASSGLDGRGFPPAYALEGTPCALVLKEGSVSCAGGVGRRFPADEKIELLGVESFSGRALRDAANSPIGLIAVMGVAPRAWGPDADALLSILALCAELELRRIRSARKLSGVARQWTATVDTIPDFVAVIAPDYRLLRANLALANFAGCFPKDLVGRKCHEVLHGLDQPWQDCPHEQAMHAGRTVALEVDDPHIGLPLCVTCTPFFDEDGAVAGTVHLARDISEQRQAARERECLIGELRETLAKVKVLSGFLPICSVCKKIRNDKGYWEQVEVYVRDRTDAHFSHGICPECARGFYPAHFP